MTSISTLGQALAQVERIKDQQDLFSSLSTQLATGKKTQKLSGLGTDVLSIQRARADFTSIDTYVSNITNADRRIKLSLNAIEEFQAQAENFAAALMSLSQTSAHQEGDVVYYDDPLTLDVVEAEPLGYTSANADVDFETLQDLATNIFDFLTELLNTKDGDRYLLSGADTNSKPLVNTGLLESALSTQINDWKGGTLTTTDFIANLQDRTVDDGNLDAITDTVVGYSSSLSAGTNGKVFVRVSKTSELDYTVLANDSGFRDILVAAAYIKDGNLPPIADQVEIDETTGLPIVVTEGAPGDNIEEMQANFYEVFNELTAMVNAALDDIDQQRFKLETVRARIDEIKTGHQEQQNVLLSSISDIEDVAIEDVAVKINALQVQLDASYRITARLQELTLVNFI